MRFLTDDSLSSNMFSTLQKDEVGITRYEHSMLCYICLFGQHAAIKKQFAERYSKSHVMKPEVVSVIQENVDAFVTRATEQLGASIDIYVRLLLSL